MAEQAIVLGMLIRLESQSQTYGMYTMTEDDLNKKLADPKLTPEEKKRLQDEYNSARDHFQNS